MKKNLMQRMKQGATVASMGLAGLLGGCAVTPQMNDLATSAAYNFIGSAGAEAGRQIVNPGAGQPSQVNVYGNGGNQQNKNLNQAYLDKPLIMIFKWTDLNNDKVCDLNEIYETNSFRPRENVILMVGGDDKYTIRLFSSKQELVNYIECMGDQSKTVINRYQLQEIGEYIYAIYSANKGLLEQRKIEVIP